MKNEKCNNPETLRDAVTALLPNATKPARYIGGEINAAAGPWDDADTKIAIAFPDTYEIGMSHQGMAILYSIVNAGPRLLCDRVFAPWTDFETIMRDNDIPLYGLETFRPLDSFDIVGFTLQYELCYTNVINMLDLARIPLHAAERDPSHPLVIAGGPCAFNSEPIADFMDAIVIGDGENAILDLIGIYEKWRDDNADRPELMRRLAGIEGVYVPSLYGPEYTDNRFARLTQRDPAAPASIPKRTEPDLDAVEYPRCPLVPFISIVHDRVAVEVMRGCERGCRFCQAGMVYRPRRERSPDNVIDLITAGAKATGHDEVSLTSLSTSDYSGLMEVVEAVSDNNVGLERSLALSLPSLRTEGFTEELAQRIAGTRKTGFTFAPEAGTERLRAVINKPLDEEKFMQCILALFRSGWQRVKLYFMVGLPTETDEDLLGIIRMARAVAATGRKAKGRGARIAVSISAYIPKAHTPFQWEDFVGGAELDRRYKVILDELRDRSIEISWRDGRVATLEAAFARGDRRLAELVHAAWRHGARFDAWSSEINWDVWSAAWAETGLEPEMFTGGWSGKDTPLPWGHIDAGVSPQFMWRERERAMNGELWTCSGEGCAECQGCEYAKV
jgi:radical SAM family uncharacterized protein